MVRVVRCVLRIAVALLAVAPLAAQFTHTIPNGFATTPGSNSNAFPWTNLLSGAIPGMRYQAVYDAPEFTGGGITTPILIQRLKWRAAPTLSNWTGGTFTQVVVKLCTSPVTAMNVQPNWATQHGPDLTTVYSGPVTVPPGTGSTPGPTTADITLTQPFLYNPALGPLTIDLDIVGFSGSVPNPDIALVPGTSRVWASSSYPNPDGAWTSHGPVVEITYVPAGSYAYTVSFGAGCGNSETSFYEQMDAVAFDLGNSAMSMISIGTGYLVLPGLATFVPPSATAITLVLGDETEVVRALSGPFPYPGGSTNALAVCSNGYVSTGPGNPISNTPGAAALLNAPVTSWRCWHNFNPGAAGSGPVKFEEVGNVAIVTWNGVLSSGTATPSTFQMQFDRSIGAVHFVWQTMSNAGGPYVVGYSPGGNSVDPGPRDLSVAVPATFTTALSDVPRLRHATTTRPVLGTMATLAVHDIPASATVGLIVVSPTAPNYDLTGLGAPGCWVYAGLDIQLPFVPLGPSHSVSLGVPNIAALAGIHYFSQAGVYAPLNSLGVITSNGLDHKLDAN